MRKSPKKRTNASAKAAAPKDTRSAKTSARQVRAEPSLDEIRQRAYEIYVRRGGAPGKDVDDWIAAERELRGA
ncbi:MAG TPA: DUF2934 domain-containing protein [Planctomycetota bacterium]|nr:DUF2934 domain-containing protein [Planctomycetota bacterium]